MCQFYGIGAVFRAFVEKEDREALVHTHKEDLLHYPHNVRESRERALKREDLCLGHTACEVFVGATADDDAFAVLLGVNENVECDRLKHAGSRENAHLAGEDAVEGDLLAVLGENVKAQTAGLYETNTRTACAVVDVSTLAEVDVLRGSLKGLAVVLGHTLPKGEGLFKYFNKLLLFHGKTPK